MAYRTARPILRKRGPVPLSRDLANRADHELLLARRHALPSLHPLNEDCLGVADGTADLEVGRSVTAHAGLGEPRQAHAKEMGRLFRRLQTLDAGAGLGGLDSHIGSPKGSWLTLGEVALEAAKK
jgi:hypothetical protein